MSIFDDPLAMTIPDPLHSVGESRHVTMGLSNQGNLLVVSHKETAETIRLISARKVTLRERKAYEEK
jgi:uncharacterized protein